MSAVTVRLAVDASAHPSQRDVLDRFTQAWGDQDLHQVSECLHPDVTYRPSVGSPFVGVEKVHIFTVHDGLIIEKDAYRRIAFDPQISAV